MHGPPHVVVAGIDVDVDLDEAPELGYVAVVHGLVQEARRAGIVQPAHVGVGPLVQEDVDDDVVAVVDRLQQRAGPVVVHQVRVRAVLQKLLDGVDVPLHARHHQGGPRIVVGAVRIESLVAHEADGCDVVAAGGEQEARRVIVLLAIDVHFHQVLDGRQRRFGLGRRQALHDDRPTLPC